jgi:hypothetical protein
VFLTERRQRPAARDHYLPEDYREGWLVFESSEGEKRRLAPVPGNWEALTDEELATLCARATVSAPRLKERTADRAAPLRPQLHEMEHRLEEALGEVCRLPAPTKLNTGELIRVEETLALATEAAKEAVSLRRKIRADRGASGSGDSPQPGAAL